MDVCVLGCTPGHIPRYMGQTSNNNKRCPLWTPVMMPVMTPVTPVMDSRYAYYDSCYARYGLLLCLLCVPVMTTL